MVRRRRPPPSRTCRGRASRGASCACRRCGSRCPRRRRTKRRVKVATPHRRPRKLSAVRSAARIERSEPRTRSSGSVRSRASPSLALALRRRGSASTRREHGVRDVEPARRRAAARATITASPRASRGDHRVRGDVAGAEVLGERALEQRQPGRPRRERRQPSRCASGGAAQLLEPLLDARRARAASCAVLLALGRHDLRLGALDEARVVELLGGEREILLDALRGPSRAGAARRRGSADRRVRRAATSPATSTTEARGRGRRRRSTAAAPCARARGSRRRGGARSAPPRSGT